MKGKPVANENVRDRIWWMAVAAVAALVPEIVLPLRSYLAYGYLTLDAAVLVTLLLPCATVALLASVHEARPLWIRGSRQNAVAMLGLNAFGLLFAGAVAISLWSGQASCYECGFGWFFMVAFPSLVLELVVGVTWLLLLCELAMEERRHFRGPLPTIR